MIGIEVWSRPPYPPEGDPKWFFRVRAANGEIVAQSESYTTKAAAEKGIRALRRALLPGTRDAEALAKAWDEGFTAGITPVKESEPRTGNPYREEVPHEEPPC